MKGSRNKKEQGMCMKMDGLGPMKMIEAVMNQMTKTNKRLLHCQSRVLIQTQVMMSRKVMMSRRMVMDVQLLL
jgi:hypothetical protein